MLAKILVIGLVLLILLPFIPAFVGFVASIYFICCEEIESKRFWAEKEKENRINNNNKDQ